MLKKCIRVFLNCFLLLIILCCLIWSDLVIYGLSQAAGQITIIIKAQPIEEVLKDKTFPDSLKQKLILVNEIKKYAVDSLGINPSNNYSDVYDQEHKAILLTVSACEPYSFKPKEWNFPVLGSVPYKGFFNKDNAKNEINELIKQGYDVDVYSPSGWSTLGWFNDPVLSNMLYRSDGQLANLIIHELTHGTLFIKNNVDYSENLANFIGDKGAEQFLSYKFGNNSKELIKYQQHKADDKTYSDYMLKSIERLDSLYTQLNKEKNVLIKKEKKKKLILEIVKGVNKLHLYKRENYFKFSLQAISEKNAFFMGFQRYDSQYDVFEKEYTSAFNGNLKTYLNYLKNKYPSM
jgi:predicted aminopeptidase